MPTAIETLKNERYVSLETYRQDGTPVRVPVGVVELDGRLMVWTDGTSFKAKRLRNNTKARLAGCDARGNVRGEWFDCTGDVLDAPEAFSRVDRLIKQKYGWQRSLVVLLYWMRRRWPGFVALAFTPRETPV